MKIFHLPVAIGVAALITAIMTPLIQAATFTPLGGLSSEFFIESKALGISGNGSVVVGYSDSKPIYGRGQGSLLLDHGKRNDRFG